MGLFDGIFNNKRKPRRNDGIRRVVLRKRIKPQIVVRDDFWQDFDIAGWSLDKMGEDAGDLV